MPQHRPIALWVLIVVVIAVVGATGVTSARSLQRVLEAQHALTQTLEFDQSLRSLHVQLLLAETGQRGYLLTGRVTHLEPYFRAIEAMQHEQGKLETLTQADSASGPLLRRLRDAVSARLQQLDRTVALYGAGQVSEALERVESGDGKRLMEAVRAASDELVDSEDRRTAERSAEQNVAVRSATLVLAVSMLLNLVLLGSLVHHIRSNTRAAQLVHREMEARNRELARMLESTAARSAHVHALTELSRYLQSALHVDEAARLLQKHLHRLLKADNGALYLTADRQQLRVACNWGVGPWVELLEPTECWALRRGQPLRQVASRVSASCEHLACAHESATTAVSTECLPLVAHGELVGMLVLTSNGREPPSADADELKLQQMTLEQVSLCIGNLRLRESLRQQSIRDVLTGLYNRRFLEESVQRELLRAERLQSKGAHQGLALLMVDIDHFKRFNDAHGHEVGDQVLREVAQVLQRGIRSSDVVARHGGEEFVVLLPDADAAGAVRRAEQLRLDVEQHALCVEGRVVGPITLSIGVAHCPQHGNTHERLLQVADKALYEAKRAGRNQVVLAQPVPGATDLLPESAAPASERRTSAAFAVHCDA